MNIEKLMKNLKDRGFTPYYFETKEEAVEHLASQIKGQNVVFGGSMTVQEMGLYDALAKENKVFWHWKDKTPGQKEAEIAEQVYITSANAIAETGELVNIDGRGNRVANSMYGPEMTVFVAGINKVTPDLTSAIARARNIAAPKNAQRLNKNTPCAKKVDRCYDCSSADRICNVMAVYMGKMTGFKQMQVILINQELGY